MENVLHKHKQERALGFCLGNYEQESIKTINKFTKEGTCVVILQERIYKRYSKFSNELASNSHVLSYRRSVNELFSLSHPLRQIIPSDLIKTTLTKKVKTKVIGDDRLIFCIDLNDYLTHDNNYYAHFKDEGLLVLGATCLLSGTDYFTKTSSLLKSNGIKYNLTDIAKLYLSLVKDTNENTTELGSIAAREKYGKVLNNLTWRISSYTRNNDKLNYLLGVFLDVGLINNEELTKFICEHYSIIPYFDNHQTVSSAVFIEHTNDENEYNVIRKTEMFIKGDGVVAHIINDLEHGLEKFDLYKTADKESIRLFGYDYCLDDDFLEGRNIEVFMMYMSIYSDMNPKTDFSFNHRKSYEYSLTEGKDRGLYYYLVARKGMHNPHNQE